MPLWTLTFAFALAFALASTFVPALAHADERPLFGLSVNDEPDSLLTHPEAIFWLSGQANLITQTHPAFPALYSGPNSLGPSADVATSYVVTLFTGARLNSFTEAIFDGEAAGGRGLSDALGLAGVTNLDAVRNPALGKAPYIARAMLHVTVPLSNDWVDVHRSALSLKSQLPARRLEIRVGRFSTADFFDNNTYGSDSHLQFMNWTVDNNGAYDYAADTRGYSIGALVEYQAPNWGVRFAEMLMPKVANGPVLDFDVLRDRAENLEGELRQHVLKGREGTVRLLAYVNHANMGVYRDAISNFEAGLTPVPDITTVRKKGNIKYGFGLNVEQPVSDSVGLFARLGWNEGRHESFAYTEVDDTLQLGAFVSGSAWSRPADRTGAVVVSNGISSDHREYLALGGSGFLLGDGALRYGRESIFETFYTFSVAGGFFIAGDFQFIDNPGYNQDRGPVEVFSIRAHLEI